MASLCKMQILGLRSFGPDDRDKANITFNTPLTLILGQNGCGKTTIIEALKYATSGELPANTNQGSGFVHDPKINNRIEVRGQVKLVCTTTKGEQICVARSVMVQQRNKKLNFKTIDATITRINPETNEKESLSGRCADIDLEMCYRLGVTKPILNFVIFCHQEDSCWPLEENKKLKEKFDAIFDATKYNKCIEDIRKERKIMQQDLKVKEGSLSYLKKFEEEAKDKRKVIEQTSVKLVETTQEVKDMEETLKPILENIAKLKDSEKACSRLHTKRETLKGRIEELQRSKKDLLKTINKVFEGSDEELETAIRDFERDSSEKKRQLGVLESEKKALNTEIRGNQKKIEEKNKSQGQLAHAEEGYQKNIISRNKDVTIIAKKLDLQALNTTQLSATGTDTMDILEQISSKIVESKESLELIRVSNEEAEKQVRRQIDTCREKKAKNEQEIENKEKQLKDVNSDYEKVTNDIREADESVNTLRVLESRLDRVNKDLEEFNQTVNLQDIEKTIEEQKRERDRLDEQVNSLEKEREDLRSLQNDQMKLNEWRKEKEDQEMKIRRLKNKHADLLQQLLGQIPEQGIKKVFEDRINTLTSEINTKKEAISERNNKLINLKTNRKNKAEKLAEMQSDLRAKENEIYELTENKDFDTLLNEVTDEIQKKQDLKGTWYGTEYLYKKYINKLKQPDSCCPLCHRDFDSRQEAEELVDELNANVAKIPQQSLEIARQLEVLLDKQSRLFQLKPINEKVISLKNIEIPALESELGDIVKEIEKLQREHDTLKSDLVDPERDEASAKNALSDIIQLNQLMIDLRDLEHKMADLQAKLGSRNQGASFDQVSEDLKRKKESLQNIRKSLDSNQTKLQVESGKLNELTANRNQLVQQQLELRGKSQRRAELADKQTELQGVKAALRIELDEKKDELQPLSSELKKLVTELERTLEENSKVLEEERNIIIGNENKFGAIKELQCKIEEYERNDGTAKLYAVKEELNALQQQKEELENQLIELNSKIDEIKKFNTNLNASRQNLNSNKTLRKKNETEKQYQDEIEQLRSELESLNPEKVQKDLRDLSKEEEKINRKINQANGKLGELQIKIEETKTELNKDDYKNAEANYRNLLIELKVRTLAVQDLGNYMVALEWAMIHFHKERMKTINTIIRNLWRQIYSGNDIDTIEIKTEESDSNTADKRRVYNYRVVCKRGDIEMDMRGRCSAGQKVLACLIIRMALAETFSKNCGILALDEPTTNLDQENIDSLSTALADIIAARSRQKNFQLIIITHDEDFLLRLSQHEKIPSYLKVQRNQYGKSEVLEIEVQ